jgi:hypothetical protein
LGSTAEDDEAADNSLERWKISGATWGMNMSGFEIGIADALERSDPEGGGGKGGR